MGQEMAKESAEPHIWISEAISLSDHQDGAIYAAADGAMAIGMQQGARARSSRTAA